MSPHLLLVTIGPVQEFIAQARRTRDLWYGSHLLSELSRSAARAIAERGARLIFPALESGDPELEPCDTPLRGEDPPLAVANKILAEVPGDLDPVELASAARSATLERWRRIALVVKQRCSGLLRDDVDEVWDEQVETFLEFTAGWRAVDDDYASARRELEQGVASRKLLRDFSPWRAQTHAVPKSSLDGARETVLGPAHRESGKSLRHRYRIPATEQLDAIGLVKRAGGEPEQFVPVPNVGLAVWLRRAREVAARELADIEGRAATLHLDRVVRRGLPAAEAFAFSATLLLPDRCTIELEEAGVSPENGKGFDELVTKLARRVGHPFPYVACLVADGDRMGAALDRLDSADQHRDFSRRLARFASSARRIVEQEHLGVLVYSGGDDVFAFVPVATALACADALRREFAALMAEDHPEPEAPTLSVGVGIGHLLESMGDLLELGRSAERLAKVRRNSLAVVVDKRSGGMRRWTETWEENPVQVMQDALGLVASRLPARKIYEIDATLRRLPHPSGDADPAWTKVLRAEVRRSLARVEGGGLSPEEAGLDLAPGSPYEEAHRTVWNWVDRMLIARTLAQATPTLRRLEDPAA